MKKLLKQGEYILYETKKHTKILNLDKDRFALVTLPKIGNILVKSYIHYPMANKLSSGKYKLIDIKDEPKLIDLPHLQLQIGSNQWQGYLLPKGLPTYKQKRHRIIATDELVSI